MPTATDPPSRKGAERKSRILDAALTIIGRDGLAALSMRTLATEAGLPLGAVGYYFANKKQLIGEAFEAHSRRELQRVVQTISSIGDAGSGADLAERLIEFVVDGLQNEENSLVAEYEFLVEASRRPEVARASTAWQQALQAQLANVLRRLGSSEPATDARLIMGAIAGLEVDNLTSDALTRTQTTAICETLTRLVEALSLAWARNPPERRREKHS